MKAELKEKYGVEDAWPVVSQPSSESNKSTKVRTSSYGSSRIGISQRVVRLTGLLFRTLLRRLVHSFHICIIYIFGNYI